MSLQTIFLYIYYIFAKAITKVKYNSAIEGLVLNWALEKLKTIKVETTQFTEQELLNIIKDAVQGEFGEFYPEIPVDFDSLTYLVLNPDLLYAGIKPMYHFITHGNLEGRAYKL